MAEPPAGAAVRHRAARDDGGSAGIRGEAARRMALRLPRAGNLLKQYNRPHVNNGYF